MLIAPPGYGDPYAQSPQVAPDHPLSIALVGADAPRSQPRSATRCPFDLPALHERPEAYNLVPLTLAQIEDHRFAAPFGADVDLRREATLRCLEPRSFGLLFHPCRMLVSPNYGRIQVVHLPVQPSLCVFVALQSSGYAIPHPGPPPAVEAACNRPPRTVLLGQIAPRGSGTVYPEAFMMRR